MKQQLHDLKLYKDKWQNQNDRVKIVNPLEHILPARENDWNKQHFMQHEVTVVRAYQLPCSPLTFSSYISPTYSTKRLEESDMLFHNFG